MIRFIHRRAGNTNSPKYRRIKASNQPNQMNGFPEEDDMGLAKEHKLQEEINAANLAEEQKLIEAAKVLGFSDLYGGIEDGGLGLRGTINGRVVWVKDYLKELEASNPPIQ